SRFNMISCHIGSGASACAIRNMRCVDTSMGFTPLAGLMMGSRSGDIDPSIIPYIMEEEGKSADEVIRELNKNSGLVGISGASDMRDILELCEMGDQGALLVRRMFVRRIVNYIAQYYVLLGGADTLVFTGGIGENSPDIRRMICEKLECLDLLLDPIKNETHGKFAEINTRHSKIKVYIVPANEELMIALDTYRIIDGNNDDVTGRLLDGWLE
ncbi:MAG: acetate kinase, partial [Mogibacterium sp.]|nr:acetate kinase [Mogibacterium sp.]